MKLNHPLTLMAAAALLVPVLSQSVRLTAGEPLPPPPPPPPVPPAEVEGQPFEGHLERQLEALSRAIDSLANQYQGLLEQQLGRIQGGLSNLPDLLELRLGGAAPGLPEPPPAPAPPPGVGSPGRLLTLYSNPIALGDQEALREDLLVMSRVLERAAGELRSGSEPSGGIARARAMGLELISVSVGGQPARTLYLEDYGALFSLQVRFPLLPPASTVETAPAQDRADDSEWEAARRDLYGRSSSPDRALVANLRWPALVSPTEAYDEAKVTQLRDALLEALKQAHRIRGLQPDDHLLLYVQGVAAGAATGPRHEEIRAHTGTLEPTTGERRGRVPAAADRLRRSNPTATVMTLRVTKADVDAFARGDLEFAGFRDRASIQIYPEMGAAGTGFSWF